MYFEETFLVFDKNNLPSILINRAIDNLIKNQIPFKLKNFLFVNETEIKSHFQDAEESTQINKDKVEETLLKILFRQEKFLKISASEDGSFSGIAETLSQISTTIDDYLSYDGELKLYLSQINIKERLLELEQKQNLNLIAFKGLEDIIKRNFNLDNFDSINAWHSKANVISKFHYDYYENFLSVVNGRKEVFLSPYSADIISSDMYGENTINQASRVNYKKSGIAALTKFRKIKKISLTKKISLLKGSIYEILLSMEDSVDNILLKIAELEILIAQYSNVIRTKIGNEFLIKTTVGRNETLYIPEGYWHKVNTIGNNNLAVNFWWNNFNKILTLDKELFTIKSSLYSMVEKQMNFKGKFLLIEKFNYLKEFRDYVVNDLSEGLIYFLFRLKFDLDKFVLLYYCFENYESFETQKDNFFKDWNALIAKFWGMLAKHNKEHLMFKKFKTMRRIITRRIIKDYVFR